MIADDLSRYGEDAAARSIWTCSDDELVRVCSVAEWLLYNGPSQPSGASMLIAKACALAAVYVHEGAPRHLTRSRRGPVTGREITPTGGRRPDARLAAVVPHEYGTGNDARDFWGDSA